MTRTRQTGGQPRSEFEREVARGQAYAAAMLTSIWGVLPPQTPNIPSVQ